MGVGQKLRTSSPVKQMRLTDSPAPTWKAGEICDVLLAGACVGCVHGVRVCAVVVAAVVVVVVVVSYFGDGRWGCLVIFNLWWLSLAALVTSLLREPHGLLLVKVEIFGCVPTHHTHNHIKKTLICPIVCTHMECMLPCSPTPHHLTHHFILHVLVLCCLD